MIIFVCVKQVPDTETKIKLKPDKSGIDDSQIKWIVNPYDEFAIEEALKLKSSQSDSKVVLLSLGSASKTMSALRTGLAMGADEAIAIDTDEKIDAFCTAKALSLVIQKESSPYLMIFTGRLSIDNNQASVSQALAEFLKIPHATVVTKFKYENQIAFVEREIENGTKEIIELKTPAVISANKGLNTPRYASLPGIMKAKKKPIKTIKFSDLDMQEQSKKIQFVQFALPDEKQVVKMLDGDTSTQVKTLTELLRKKDKVI